MTDNIVPEIRLALFGQSGSGKTTFLASYYGNQQRNSFEEVHGYRLEAEDVSDGNELLSRYYRMETGRFPMGTERFSEYRFGLKVSGLSEPGLRVVWYDYPGGWWERDPKDESEKAARREALKKLLTSQVGILLIDGSRYRNEGVGYIRLLLNQFGNEIRRLSDHIKASGDGAKLTENWIIAVSKADLIPGLTAEFVCKDVVKEAADQLKGIAKTLETTAFGHQFLLLSSVQGNDDRVLDAHKYSGLQLVAPVALLSMLVTVVEEAGKSFGSNLLAGILEGLSGIVHLIDKLDDFLPKKWQLVTRFLKAMSFEDILNKGADHFRKKQAKAVSQGKALEAAAAAMEAELASEAAKSTFYRNQREVKTCHKVA